MRYHRQYREAIDRLPAGMVSEQNCVGCAPCCTGIALKNIMAYYGNGAFMSNEFPAVILRITIFGFPFVILIFASGKYVINGTRVDAQLCFVTLLTIRLLLACGATKRSHFSCVCPVTNRVFCGYIDADIDLPKAADAIRDVRWRPYTFPSANYYMPLILCNNGQLVALLLLTWYHFATGMEIDDASVLSFLGLPEPRRGHPRGVGAQTPKGISRAKESAASVIARSVDSLGIKLDLARPLREVIKQADQSIEDYYDKLARHDVSGRMKRRPKVVFSARGRWNELSETQSADARRHYDFFSKVLRPYIVSDKLKSSESFQKETARRLEEVYGHQRQPGLIASEDEEEPAIDPGLPWQEGFKATLPPIDPDGLLNALAFLSDSSSDDHF